MTGGQEHAGTGRTASGSAAPKLDIGKLCQAIGAKRVRGDRCLQPEGARADHEGRAWPSPARQCSSRTNPACCGIRSPGSAYRGVDTAIPAWLARPALKARMHCPVLCAEGKKGHAKVDELLCNGLLVSAVSSAASTNSMVNA